MLHFDLTRRFNSLSFYTENPKRFTEISSSSNFGVGLGWMKHCTSSIGIKFGSISNNNKSLWSFPPRKPTMSTNAHFQQNPTSITGSVSSEHLELANELADEAGKILRQYFRKRIDIIDKDDQSPVTIADQTAERVMRALISKRFPSHAIFGEEWGLEAPKEDFEYLWVLDPIDGTKSFITGKPVFGTLICLVHKSIPVLGIIDQPVTRERWVGIKGQRTRLNGQEIETRPCSSLGSAYLYTTSPHLFSGAAAESFARVREKVKVPLYGCDCYAYGLLAAGHVDLVIESGLKPYDFLALVPVVEGAGGRMTNWKGENLQWWPVGEGSKIEGTDVVAAGDHSLHGIALTAL